MRLLLTTGPTGTSTRKKAEVLSGDIKRPFCRASDKGQRNRFYNMSKTADVTQDSEETPGDFYERLCEGFHIYTPFDPEAPENQRMVNVAFVAQLAPNICRKLQKLEGFARMNITQLLEVANKVFCNRDNIAN